MKEAIHNLLDSSIRNRRSKFYEIGILLLVCINFLFALVPVFKLFPSTEFTLIIKLLLQIIGFLFLVKFIEIDTKKSIVQFMFITCGFLFIWSLITSLFSSMPDVSFRRTLFVFLPSLMLMMVVISDKNVLKTFCFLARFISYFGIFLSIIGLTLRFFGKTVIIDGIPSQALFIGPIKIYQYIYGIPPFLRLLSLTGNPNELGILLVLSLVFTIFLFIIKNFSLIKFILFFIPQITALILTFSRTSIGIFIIFLVLMSCLIKFGKNDKVIKLFILLFIILFAMLFYANIPINNISSQNTDDRLSLDLNERNIIWKIVLENIKNHPFTGVGFGVSTEVILKPKGFNLSTHNFYLTVLSEIGYIGLFFTLLFSLGIMFYSVIKINKIKILSKEAYLAGLFSILLLIVLFLHQFFESRIMNHTELHFLWIFLLSFLVRINSNNSVY